MATYIVKTTERTNAVKTIEKTGIAKYPITEQRDEIYLVAIRFYSVDNVSINSVEYFFEYMQDNCIFATV
jgi:hypothetical protein